MSGPPVALPAELAAKVSQWPEFRMGVHRVVVVLRDGSKVSDVFVSGGAARGVCMSADALGPTPFGADDVADVEDASGW